MKQIVTNMKTCTNIEKPEQKQLKTWTSMQTIWTNL